MLEIDEETASKTIKSGYGLSESYTQPLAICKMVIAYLALESKGRDPKVFDQYTALFKHQDISTVKFILIGLSLNSRHPELANIAKEKAKTFQFTLQDAFELQYTPTELKVLEVFPEFAELAFEKISQAFSKDVQNYKFKRVLLEMLRYANRHNKSDNLGRLNGMLRDLEYREDPFGNAFFLHLCDARIHGNEPSLMQCEFLGKSMARFGVTAAWLALLQINPEKKKEFLAMVKGLTFWDRIGTVFKGLEEISQDATFTFSKVLRERAEDLLRELCDNPLEVENAKQSLRTYGKSSAFVYRLKSKIQDPSSKEYVLYAACACITGSGLNKDLLEQLKAMAVSLAEAPLDETVLYKRIVLHVALKTDFSVDALPRPYQVMANYYFRDLTRMADIPEVMSEVASQNIRVIHASEDIQIVRLMIAAQDERFFQENIEKIIEQYVNSIITKDSHHKTNLLRWLLNRYYLSSYDDEELLLKLSEERDVSAALAMLYAEQNLEKNETARRNFILYYAASLSQGGPRDEEKDARITEFASEKYNAETRAIACLALIGMMRPVVATLVLESMPDKLVALKSLIAVGMDERFSKMLEENVRQLLDILLKSYGENFAQDMASLPEEVSRLLQEKPVDHRRVAVIYKVMEFFHESRGEAHSRVRLLYALSVQLYTGRAYFIDHNGFDMFQVLVMYLSRFCNTENKLPTFEDAKRFREACFSARDPDQTFRLASFLYRLSQANQFAGGFQTVAAELFKDIPGYVSFREIIQLEIMSLDDLRADQVKSRLHDFSLLEQIRELYKELQEEYREKIIYNLITKIPEGLERSHLTGIYCLTYKTPAEQLLRAGLLCQDKQYEEAERIILSVLSKFDVENDRLCRRVSYELLKRIKFAQFSGAILPWSRRECWEKYVLYAGCVAYYSGPITHSISTPYEGDIRITVATFLTDIQRGQCRQNKFMTYLLDLNSRNRDEAHKFLTELAADERFKDTVATAVNSEAASAELMGNASSAEDLSRVYATLAHVRIMQSKMKEPDYFLYTALAYLHNPRGKNNFLSKQLFQGLTEPNLPIECRVVSYLALKDTQSFKDYLITLSSVEREKAKEFFRTLVADVRIRGRLREIITETAKLPILSTMTEVSSDLEKMQEAIQEALKKHKLGSPEYIMALALLKLRREFPDSMLDKLLQKECDRQKGFFEDRDHYIRKQVLLRLVRSDRESFGFVTYVNSLIPIDQVLAEYYLRELSSLGTELAEIAKHFKFLMFFAKTRLEDLKSRNVSDSEITYLCTRISECSQDFRNTHREKIVHVYLCAFHHGYSVKESFGELNPPLSVYERLVQAYQTFKSESETAEVKEKCVQALLPELRAENHAHSLYLAYYMLAKLSDPLSVCHIVYRDLGRVLNPASSIRHLYNTLVVPAEEKIVPLEKDKLDEALGLVERNILTAETLKAYLDIFEPEAQLTLQNYFRESKNKLADSFQEHLEENRQARRQVRYEKVPSVKYFQRNLLLPVAAARGWVSIPSVIPLAKSGDAELLHYDL